MANIEDDLHFVGNFHLGETYNITRWANSEQKGGKKLTETYLDTCKVFQCQEQDEEDESKFHGRYLVVTPGVFLILEPIDNLQGYGTLQSWASL